MPELRVGGYAPRDSTHGRALESIAEGWRRATGGEVDVLWNIMDEGRPATDLLDMVEAGDLDLCYFSTSYLGSRVPGLEALETPFLFDDLEHAHVALDGRFGAALTEATEAATGFRVLGYWDNGFRHLTNRLHPVRHPHDLAGMRVRLQPNAVHADMVESWGAVPVPVELSAGIEMIRNLEVDAQENPLANTFAYGVDRVHPHVTMTAHLYGARGVYANPNTLDAAPARVRDEMQSVVVEAIRAQRRDAERTEASLRARMTGAGAEFVDLDPVERGAFQEAAADVIDRARASHPPDLFGLIG